MMIYSYKASRYLFTDFQLVARDEKCDGDERWIVTNVWNSQKNEWIEEKFHRHHAVEACAKRCNGVASMFRVRMCKNGLCDCVCEVGASHEGTCFRVTQHSHRLFRYVSKGMNVCTSFNFKWKLKISSRMAL